MSEEVKKTRKEVQILKCEKWESAPDKYGNNSYTLTLERVNNPDNLPIWYRGKNPLPEGNMPVDLAYQTTSSGKKYIKVWKVNEGGGFKGGSYKFSKEDMLSKFASMALSYANQAFIADKINKDDVLSLSEKYAKKMLDLYNDLSK